MTPRMLKIVIEQVPLDCVDEAIIAQHGHGEGGSALSVSFEGNVSAIELGKALGAVTRGWLRNVRKAGTNEAPNRDEEERLLDKVLQSYALALHVAIHVEGGGKPS